MLKLMPEYKSHIYRYKKLYIFYEFINYIEIYLNLIYKNESLPDKKLNFINV